MALLITGQVAAQTTVTAPGLTGDAACAGGYSDSDNGQFLGAGDLIPNGAGTHDIIVNNFSMVTYSFLRGREGDAATSSFPMKLRLVNTGTGAVVTIGDAGTIDSTNTNPGRDTITVSVAAKTTYAAIYYAEGSRGSDLSSPIARYCFMTGGTYTINNEGSQNFIGQVWNMVKRDADLSNECTIDGQLGNRAARESEALANLNRSFGNQANYNRMTSKATCNSKCDERFPRSDTVSDRAKSACKAQCAAARSSIPDWATLLANEVAAIERTFDPGKCRAPAADQPQSNGCYSISPRTPLDVHNCLCGRSPRAAGLTGCDTS